MECFGVWRDEISRILPSKYRLFCLQQPWSDFCSKEFGESSRDWQCLDRASTIHSLPVAAVFFQLFLGSWGCHNLKQSYKSRGGNDLSLCEQRAHENVCGVLPAKKKKRKSQDGIPDLSQPSSTEKLQLTQGAKLEIFSRDTLAPNLSATGGWKTGEREFRELSVPLSEGFPQLSGNAQTRSGRAVEG